MLLVLVLIICALGVVEIYSATLNTKFMGIHIKQVYWIARRRGADVHGQLVNYQALLERVPLMYVLSIASLLAVRALRQEVSGRAPLGTDAARSTSSPRSG